MALIDKIKQGYNNRFGEKTTFLSEAPGHINNFFTLNNKFSKSIQKNFKFIVDFDLGFEKELADNNIFLQDYHVLSVDMPTSYGFKFEKMMVGPYSYSFPTMDHNGFDVSIVYEEDKDSSIAKMIHYLQYKIIGDVGSGANGNYNPQSQNRIKVITVNIYNDFGEIVRTVEYYDMFFTAATPTALNYDSNESLKYTVTFHGDFMSQTFNK